MKKIIFVASLILFSFCAIAQKSNSFGQLKKGVLSLNNGAVISEKDTIRIGEPKDGGEEFTYIYEPKRLLGLAGGGSIPAYRIQNSRLIVHYITTGKGREDNEKSFVAALGYGGSTNALYFCDIAQAIDAGEIRIKGIEPKKSEPKIKTQANTAALVAEQTKLDEEKAKLDEEKRKLEEEKIRLKQEKENAEAQAKQAKEDEEKRIAEAKKQKKEEEKNIKKEAKSKLVTSGNSLLDKINALQKSKDISESEHYQLLKIVTGSGNADDKKALMTKLKTLRNNNKLSIDDYDALIEKLL